MKETIKIDRDRARALGREAVQIIKAGFYKAPGGESVSIANAVRQSVDGTVTYAPESTLPISQSGKCQTGYRVLNCTTLEPVRDLLKCGHNPVLLNFASATSPGGGFLNGSRAQEEYLCRSSGLYACLNGNKMYANHRAQRDPIYSDYVIYSPGVPVFRSDDGQLLDEPYEVAMITSPAVNASRLEPGRRGEVEPAMRSRIVKVLATGLKHGHDAIILGAWGCGAFGCDTNQIAGLFREALSDDFGGAYNEVVFAVVDWSKERRFIGPFEKAFAG